MHAAPTETVVRRIQLDAAEVRVRARGELDLDAAADLNRAFDDVLARRCVDAVLCLAEVSFIDAAGLGPIVDAAVRLDEQGGRLTITGARPPVRRVFRLLDLEGLLDAAL